MTKCKLQDESWQRLAAPANWWARRMWTIRELDIRSEQRFSPVETGTHRFIRGFPFTDLRTPGDRKRFETTFAIVVHQLARGWWQHDIAGLECNGSAALTDAEHTIVLEYDRFLIEAYQRAPHERTILDLCEPLFKTRWLGLPFVAELRVGSEEAVIGSAVRTQLLRHGKSSI